MKSRIAFLRIRVARGADCAWGALLLAGVIPALVFLMGSCSGGGGFSESINGRTVVTAGAIATTTTTAPIRRVLLVGEVPATSPDFRDIAYGPLAAQRFDVYRPTPELRSVGTIVYLHSGGWSSGTRTNIAGPIRALTLQGFAVVSADYRLTDSGASAPEILSDVDRVVRFVKARGAQFGLNTSTVILSGGSAGAHLALTATSAAGRDVSADLPDDLAGVDPVIDGVAAFVGPTDLSTLWLTTELAASSSERLLKCVVAGQTPMYGFTEVCRPDLVDRYSPLALARDAAVTGRVLPPAFLCFGGADTLVRTDTQGRPLRDAWASAAGRDRVVYDEPVNGGHNLDADVDVAALEAWLDSILVTRPIDPVT